MYVHEAWYVDTYYGDGVRKVGQRDLHLTYFSRFTEHCSLQACSAHSFKAYMYDYEA
jgi:hypothetical protein